MSIGMILLIVIALLILFGVLQRVLDRMALTDRQALVLVALIFIGGWLPDLSFGMVTVNIGGALIPLGVCLYLFFTAGTGKERLRCLIASLLTAAAVYAVSVYFPAARRAVEDHRVKRHGRRVGGEVDADGVDRRCREQRGDQAAQALLARSCGEEQIQAYAQRDERAADVDGDHPEGQIGQPAADEDQRNQHERLPVGEGHAVEHALEHPEEDEQRNDNQKDHADGHG